MVALELGHDYQIVRLDHALQTETQFALEADQVVQHRHKAGVQCRQLPEQRGVR